MPYRSALPTKCTTYQHIRNRGERLSNKGLPSFGRLVLQVPNNESTLCSKKVHSSIWEIIFLGEHFFRYERLRNFLWRKNSSLFFITNASLYGHSTLFSFASIRLPCWSSNSFHRLVLGIINATLFDLDVFLDRQPSFNHHFVYVGIDLKIFLLAFTEMRLEASTKTNCTTTISVHDLDRGNFS